LGGETSADDEWHQWQSEYDYFQIVDAHFDAGATTKGPDKDDSVIGRDRLGEVS
jgi:hypothetical protein